MPAGRHLVADRVLQLLEVGLTIVQLLVTQRLHEGELVTLAILGEEPLPVHRTLGLADVEVQRLRDAAVALRARAHNVRSDNLSLYLSLSLSLYLSLYLSLCVCV
jgi:hypothetical protein